jgi:hypothetical protein
MQQKSRHEESRSKPFIKLREGPTESRFSSYESAVANQQIIDEYFAAIETCELSNMLHALRELTIIMEEDVTPISSSQFYILLNIVKDIDNDLLKSLASNIIFTISNYPGEYIERIVPFDFSACLEELLPNNSLFMIINSFIKVRKDLAQYLNDYGFVDKLESFIGPESEFNSSCLSIMRKLAEKRVFRTSFLPLLIAIISETEDDSLRVDAFNAFGAIVEYNEEARVEFLKYLPIFVEFIGAFPTILNKVFYAFAGVANSANEELVKALFCDEVLGRVIPLLSSELNIHQMLVFLSRSAKKNAIKCLLHERSDIFGPILDIIVNQNHKHSDIIEVIKLVSRLFRGEVPYDANAFIESGLFQAIVDYLPSSHHSDTNEILKGLVAFVHVAKSQGREVIEKIYDNESLSDNLIALNESKIRHKKTKQRLQLLLDFMQTEFGE